VYGGLIDEVYSPENRAEGAEGVVTSNKGTKRAVYPSKQYTVVLQLLSLFPCMVELDEISVIYKVNICIYIHIYMYIYIYVNIYELLINMETYMYSHLHPEHNVYRISVVYKECSHCENGDVLLDSFECSTPSSAFNQDKDALVLHPGAMKSIPVPFTTQSSSSGSRYFISIYICVNMYLSTYDNIL
jgi:hypothetical protein